ncbi:hypothetical protein HanHA89_Chr10g0390891 [Helianthus annuus]|nr:hypothetical protein HanHA89_Chr10g0390891 [Helianthus annuus]
MIVAHTFTFEAMPDFFRFVQFFSFFFTLFIVDAFLIIQSGSAIGYRCGPRQHRGPQLFFCLTCEKPFLE